jgi:DNA-binding MarR family transcriptional regulator
MDSSRDTPARIIQLWMDISRMLRKNMAKRGSGAAPMNHMQMHGVFMIAEHPNVTMKEFAGLMHISSPSATSFVDRLVKLRWVERVPDPENRKLVHLRILPPGREALERSLKEHSAMMHDLFSLLSDADQDSFERILANLKEALALNVPSR